MTEPQAQASRKDFKIAFFGNFGEGNLGNEGTLRAILFHLQEHMPHAEVQCVSTCHKTVAATYNVRAFPIQPESFGPGFLRRSRLGRLVSKIVIEVPSEVYRWILAINVLRHTDMLILPGTQFLSDNLTGPWEWPYHAFRWSLAAKFVRCKLVFVSVGAGPLRHPLSRFFVKCCLRLADFRSYRDESSKDYLRSIGFERPDDPVYPDLAFSLLTPSPSQGREYGNRKPVVAVGFKNYRGQYGPWPRGLSAEDTYRRYIARMAAFVAWLIEHEYTVRLVIGDVKYDTSVLADLRKELGQKKIQHDNRLLVVDRIDSLDALIAHLSTSDIVVSSRFHNIIFGLLLEKPVLAVSYHNKFSQLLESVRLARFDLPIDDADSEALIERFSELEKHRHELAPEIRSNVDRQRAALEQQYKDIISLLASRSAK